jgi:GNAT superfamily N-acetyltransferase
VESEKVTMSEIVKPEAHNISISETPVEAEAFLEALREIADLYRQSRSAPPWYDMDFPLDEAYEYVASLTQHEGFGAFLAESPEGEIIGARLHELITLDRIEAERGPALREFIQTLTASKDEPTLIWTKESFVSPRYQRQGIAKRLGSVSLIHMANQYPGGLLLCRVRSDNEGSLALIRRVGYSPTKVHQPHSTLHELWHEYWYKQL